VVSLVAHHLHGWVGEVKTMAEARAGGEGASRRRVGIVPVVSTAAYQLVLLGAASSAMASLACCGRWGRGMVPPFPYTFTLSPHLSS
jgi:hypothetical protein